jgi:iron(III) transport system substrate-binding protein
MALQPGDVWREWVGNFEKAYPGIRLEISGLMGADFVARATSERRAGQYLWDIYIGGPQSGYRGLLPAGVLDPIKPAVILPDVLDDSKWLGGFDDGFMDGARAYVYDYRGELLRTVAVNRDFVAETQLSRVEDLVDPQWKGRISMYDPRQAGKAASDAGHWGMLMGEDWLRRLLAQPPVVTTDRRQQIEWVVRGQYPIALAADTTFQTEFRRQGLGLNVRPLAPESDLGSRLAYTSTIGLINQAPHPNAAKVFLNWALSRDGQALWARITEQNSRRLDVTGPPETALDPKRQYSPSIDREESYQFVLRAMEIAKETLP